MSPRPKNPSSDGHAPFHAPPLPSGLRRLPSGLLQARKRLGNGERAAETFTNVDDALAWMADLTVQRHRGTLVNPNAGKQRFEAFVEEWKPTRAHVRSSTRTRDFGYLDRYLLPTFGPMELRAIDHMAITKWQAELLGAPLAAATVQKAGQLLFNVMAHAVKAKRIPANPCELVERPRPDDYEMKILDPCDIARLAECMDRRYRALVLLGCYGGLRIGELFALEVRDVDTLHTTVTVRRKVTDVHGRLEVGLPKTKAGRRQVPVTRLVADELAAHMAGLAQDDLVFPAPMGDYMRLNAWRQRFWRPATDAAGLNDDDGYFRIHDMRHTAITLWLRAKLDVRDIAAWAGHRSVSTVLDRYGHPSRRDETALDQLDAWARSAASGDADVVPIR